MVRDRIRYLELSIDYAAIELTMSGILPLDSTFLPLVDRFVSDGKRLGLNILHEMGYTLDEYRADIDNFLAKTNQPNLARHCPVTLLHQPDSQYYADGAKGLDLGRRTTLHEIKLDFFYFPLSWIFFPQTINFYISSNGRSWQLVGSLHPDNPQRLAVPEIKTFATPGFRSRARYVRVQAIPLSTIPSWHRATGNPAWLFTDEIIVK